MKLYFTDTAIADLDSIYFWREMPTAKKTLQTILEEIKILRNFPDIAPVDPMFNEETKTIRSLVVAKGLYRVLYYIENNYVYISRIWDCRMNPNKIKID
ncbi:MAG: type II toxin-antitoxin system RelE/ParE family toxin [Candidatus Symbiothrix sp.]|jgi:plasmid stabilization system protein ParE|nr:type II toxin-antitoxin system RelE/ParE family toxin [Candidatus Symbiothrix sp.]